MEINEDVIEYIRQHLNDTDELREQFSKINDALSKWFMKEADQQKLDVKTKEEFNDYHYERLRTIVQIKSHVEEIAALLNQARNKSYLLYGNVLKYNERHQKH